MVISILLMKDRLTQNCRRDRRGRGDRSESDRGCKQKGWQENPTRCQSCP